MNILTQNPKSTTQNIDIITDRHHQSIENVNGIFNNDLGSRIPHEEENEERLFKFSPLSSKKVEDDEPSNGLNHSSLISASFRNDNVQQSHRSN